MRTLELFWMPILLSAVLVHFASALVWMVLPIHKHDYKNPGPNEKSILDFVRSLGLTPGVYVSPWMGPGVDRKDPANIAKFKQGPYVQLTVMAPPSMGRSLLLWIVNLLGICFMVAYVAGSAGMQPGATPLHAFKVCGLIALMAHAGNALTLSIWMGMPWSQLPGRIIDALIYAAITGGVFAWLWPTLTTA